MALEEGKSYSGKIWGKSESPERGCMGLTTITKSMEEQNITPLRVHFHTMHSPTQVISKARVEGEVTC